MAKRRGSPEPSRLRREILAMSDDMRRLGIMNDEDYRKITLRDVVVADAQEAHSGHDTPYASLSGDDIRTLREQSNMSQAVFARCLNLSVGYVSQLERGAKRATGPALALLDVIRRKGIEAIL